MEAIFEGEKEDVDQLIKFSEKGPPGAKVSDLNVEWEDYEGEYEEFKLVY